MNKQQLASKIWESANKMRSKIEANEYKDYILGFIFYKFLSDKELEYLRKNEWTDEYLPSVTEEDTETVENLQKNIGYFISYNNLFSTWLKKGLDFTIDDVSIALSAFSRLINPSHKKVFSGIFKTLETGLSKLGDSSKTRTAAIRDLINLIKDIPMNSKQDYDVLGFIYEYLLANFAANAGKKAGEFYTPHEVSILMSEIVSYHLKDRNEIKIYDPTSGSGSLLINIGKSASQYIKRENAVQYYAQELKENTHNLTRMNLVMRGILPDNIITRNGDTLEDDWPYFDDSNPENTYEPLYVDAVVSNPPYSQHWNPDDKKSDPRYARFGLAPKSKADYAFLLHDLYHLKSDGIMTIVLPHGVLFRGGEEGEIRKNLIENNHIDTIIGLPANIFFGTGIPTIIMVLKQRRDNTDVLFIDASKEFEKVNKNNALRARDIRKIVDYYISRDNLPKYSKLVSREEIRKNDYNLNIPRYIDSYVKGESYDLYASMFGGIPCSEIEELNDYWSAFRNLREDLFKAQNNTYCVLKESNINDFISSHKDVLNYKTQYQSIFSDFAQFLSSQILYDIADINISEKYRDIYTNIFDRLSSIPLIDRYDAYQSFFNNWQQIALDLEIIKKEGIDCIKQVDPKMVIKRDKNKKTVEVQDGWVGHILPFAIVEKQYFADKSKEIDSMRDELNSLDNENKTIFEELSDEDKEKEFIKEDLSGFDMKTLSKTIKENIEDPELITLLKKVQANNVKANKLKKILKESKNELQLLVKNKIETMSDEEAISILNQKWISPIIVELESLPNSVIDKLAKRVQSLQVKYETTFADIEHDIKDSEKKLVSLMDKLTGNDFDMLAIEKFKTLLVDR